METVIAYVIDKWKAFVFLFIGIVLIIDCYRKIKNKRS